MTDAQILLAAIIAGVARWRETDRSDRTGQIIIGHAFECLRFNVVLKHSGTPELSHDCREALIQATVKTGVVAEVW